MIKYLVFLGLNLFVLYGIVMFIVDHRVFPKEAAALVRNGILFIVAGWICYNLIFIYLLKRQPIESGLLYMTASKIKSGGVGFYDYILPFKKELITWTLIAAGLIVIGFISVGIPGYFFLAIPVKLGLAKEISGDGAWPAALMMSFLWPLLLPIAVLVKHWILRSQDSGIALAGFWGVIVGGIVILITLIHSANK